MSLAGANTYSGGTLISAGTLQVGNGGATGSLTGAITNNAALAYNRSGEVDVNSSITGTGQIIQNGTGTLVSRAALTTTNLVINDGTFSFGNPNSLGRGTVNLGAASGSAAATLLYNDNGSGNYSNAIVLGGTSGALTVAARLQDRGISNTGTLTFAGAISGINGLNIAVTNSAATNNAWVVSFTGPINNAGLLTYTNTFAGTNTARTRIGSLGANVAGLNMANGVLVLEGTNSMTNNITVNGGLLELASSGSALFKIGANGVNNTIAGAGSALFQGTFVIDLTSADTVPGSAWTLVSVSSSSYPGFNVAGFTNSGGTWTRGTNGVTYQFVQSTGVLSVAGGTPVSPYDSWLDNYSLSGIDAEGTADPDNDGFNNNLEFAFGTIPTAGSPALLQTATSGGQFVISWLQRIDSSSNYIVEESTDLVAGSWVISSATVQDGSGATPPAGYEWKKISVTPTGKKFYRVQATIP
jgi:autotransporter-associated beta strand protein